MATNLYSIYIYIYFFLCIFTSFGLNIGGVEVWTVLGESQVMLPLSFVLFICLFVYIFIFVK